MLSFIISLVFCNQDCNSLYFPPSWYVQFIVSLVSCIIMIVIHSTVIIVGTFSFIVSRVLCYQDCNSLYFPHSWYVQFHSVTCFLHNHDCNSQYCNHSWYVQFYSFTCVFAIRIVILCTVLVGMLSFIVSLVFCYQDCNSWYCSPSWYVQLHSFTGVLLS